MAVRLGDDKPFVCPVTGCGQGFTTEDRLAVHRRKHDNVFAFPMSLDQTPTPSQFLKDCDSLFLPNPFEESFKRVNSCEQPLLVPGPADTVSTPSIVCREDDLAAAVVAAAAAELVPTQLPQLLTVDAGHDEGSMVCPDVTASSCITKTSHLPGVAGAYVAAGPGVTADLFKDLHADDCLMDATEALSSDVSVVGESCTHVLAAKKSTLPAAHTGMSTAIGGKLHQPESRVGILRSMNQNGCTSRSSGSTPVGSPVSRLTDTCSSGADGSEAADTASTTMLSAHSVGSQLVAAAPTSQPGPGGTAATSATMAAASCTMQLLLHMPNGQTVPISLPAALLQPQAMFDLGSGVAAAVAKTQQQQQPTTTDKPPSSSQVATSAAAAQATAMASASLAAAASLASSCDMMVPASDGSGKGEACGIGGISLAKQKLKEALQRESAYSGVTSSGGAPIQSTFSTSPQPAQQQYKQQPQHSEHCVGSTTGGTLRRPRQSSSEDDPEDKRVKFLERNREAARRCRSKKKEWISSLEQRNEELQISQQRQQAEIASLRAEVADLKSLLLEHQDCPVTQLQKQSGRLLTYNRSGSSTPFQDGNS